MATVSRLTLEVWNNGYYADITDLLKYNVPDYAGFGVAKVNNLTQRGPSQNGVTWLGKRFQERVIQLVVDGKGSDDDTWHTRRAELARIFCPGDDLLQLRYSVPPDRVRQWDVYVSIPPDFATRDRTGYTQRTVVELRAPDPTPYDPAGVGVQFDIGGGGNSAWTMNGNWKMNANWTFGTNILNSTKLISMAAVNAAASFPIIQITGPVTDCKLVNAATGFKLDFTGNTIGSGVSYLIDTRYASPRVTDLTGTNQISKLTDDSTLAFMLKPGDNAITATGTGITAATQISLFYYNRYQSAD